MQAIKTLNGTDGNLFCHDTGSIQGQSIFFLFWSVSLLISKPKHLLQQKRAVKAAKSNRLRLHRIKIHFNKMKNGEWKTEKGKLVILLN